MSRVQHCLVSCKGETLRLVQKRQVRRCFGSFRGSLIDTSTARPPFGLGYCSVPIAVQTAAKPCPTYIEPFYTNLFSCVCVCQTAKRDNFIVSILVYLIIHLSLSNVNCFTVFFYLQLQIKCDITDFLGNRRSAVLRRIFCVGKSVSSAALLGVMQGRGTSLGAEETSKTVLRKFPRKSDKVNSKVLCAMCNECAFANS